MKKFILLLLFISSTVLSADVNHKLSFVVTENEDVLAKMNMKTKDTISMMVKNTRREDSVEIEATPTLVKGSKDEVKMKIRVSIEKFEETGKTIKIGNHEITIIGRYGKDNTFTFKDSSGKNSYSVKVTPEKTL